MITVCRVNFSHPPIDGKFAWGLGGRMKFPATTAVLCVAIAVSACGTVNQPAEQAAANAVPTRDLTPAERGALGKALARSFKDPQSAEFKWMPVALAERDGMTDYCGLVNGKNSAGQYIGFVRFYAQLKKDPKGQLMTGRMVTVQEITQEFKLMETPWLNGLCEKFGYTDFSQAN